MRQIEVERLQVANLWLKYAKHFVVCFFISWPTQEQTRQDTRTPRLELIKFPTDARLLLDFCFCFGVAAAVVVAAVAGVVVLFQPWCCWCWCALDWLIIRLLCCHFMTDIVEWNFSVTIVNKQRLYISPFSSYLSLFLFLSVAMWTISSDNRLPYERGRIQGSRPRDVVPLPSPSPHSPPMEIDRTSFLERGKGRLQRQHYFSTCDCRIIKRWGKKNKDRLTTTTTTTTLKKPQRKSGK